MSTIDLSALSWSLEGWRPFTWKLGRSMETNWGFMPDIGPLAAQTPGSVQAVLLQKGILPDWHVGLNSRLCEWVEHRHWFFSAVVPKGVVPEGAPVQLLARGLDYSGWIIVDGREVARFEGALTPHRFDLTAALSDGKEHQLNIVFEEPPREQGQFGWTSQSRFFKPRYNYSWDWCPRFVPIGITDALTLECGLSALFDLKRVRPTLDADNATGRLQIAYEQKTANGKLPDVAELVAELRDGKRIVARATQSQPGPGLHTLTFEPFRVAPWWPNGLGDAKTYILEASALDAAGKVQWSESRTVGFKRVEWLPCEGAPEGAEPWRCVVNGVPVFLQGVNWSPVRVGYPDSTGDEYRRLINLYHEMGCNLFRVWGGGILEKEVFYEACDRSGILVWQEFPLSSSGIDNIPPSDEGVIRKLCAIASSYIERRAHHVSLVMWCGGNELMEDVPGSFTPVDAAHPCIAALKQLVAREDPEHRFIPTSPSGPRFTAKAEEFGRGLHHDTHGPWGMGEFADLDAWRAYWAKDDSLFRSEVGMPGAMTAELIRKYSGGAAVWPPTGELWQHSCAWWIDWKRYQAPLAGLDDDRAFEEYVRLTQEHQAQAYALAAVSCKQRFPRCGGFLIWMGHDCFPCFTNNSVIDFERNPKPAYYALKQVFRGESVT